MQSSESLTKWRPQLIWPYAISQQTHNSPSSEKNLSFTVINQAVENVYDTHDEEALIEQAIAKHTRLRGKPTTREESKKLCDHLLRLGFKYDLVIRKIRAIGKVEIEADDD